jgi:hypothetical protein
MRHVLHRISTGCSVVEKSSSRAGVRLALSISNDCRRLLSWKDGFVEDSARGFAAICNFIVLRRSIPFAVHTPVDALQRRFGPALWARVFFARLPLPLFQTRIDSSFRGAGAEGLRGHHLRCCTVASSDVALTPPQGGRHIPRGQPTKGPRTDSQSWRHIRHSRRYAIQIFGRHLSVSDLKP